MPQGANIRSQPDHQSRDHSRSQQSWNACSGDFCPWTLRVMKAPSTQVKCNTSQYLHPRLNLSYESLPLEEVGWETIVGRQHTPCSCRGSFATLCNRTHVNLPGHHLASLFLMRKRLSHLTPTDECHVTWLLTWLGEAPDRLPFNRSCNVCKTTAREAILKVVYGIGWEMQDSWCRRWWVCQRGGVHHSSPGEIWNWPPRHCKPSRQCTHPLQHCCQSGWALLFTHGTALSQFFTYAFLSLSRMLPSGIVTVCLIKFAAKHLVTACSKYFAAKHLVRCTWTNRA